MMGKQIEKHRIDRSFKDCASIWEKVFVKSCAIRAPSTLINCRTQWYRTWK